MTDTEREKAVQALQAMSYLLERACLLDPELVHSLTSEDIVELLSERAALFTSN